MKRARREIISLTIVFVFLVGVVTNTIFLNASGTVSEYLDVFEFRNGTEYTYPEKSGYVFAGWYTDEALTIPLGRETKIGSAYAKFVDEQILSVKYQIKVGTTVENTHTDLRIVTTVDTLFYESVGFEIEINGKKATRITNTVYETITGFKDGEGIVYQPSVFCKDSSYFMSYQMQDVPNSYFSTTMTVTPFWKTLDGTTVSGIEKDVSIMQAIENDLPSYITYGQVWSAPSTVKIEQNDTTYSPKGAATLEFQAVRDEFENTQLIITAEEDITHFELKASDLVNGSNILSAENVEIYVEKYIPYDDHNGKGMMPDALIPMSAAVSYGENTIKKSNNGALWVTIYVPKNTQAGTYSGKFLLVMDGADGRGKVDIPVSVTVYDYTLPQERNAKTLFSWRYDYTATGELNGSIEMMEYYYEFYQKYGISMQSLPMETMSGYELKEALKKYYDQLSTYTILSRVGDISTDLLYNEEIVREQILAIAELSAQQERNLFDKAMIYYQDEPDFENATIRSNVLRNLKVLRAMLERCVNIIATDTDGTYEEFKTLFPNEQEWKNAILNIPNVIPFYTEEWLLENENTEEGQDLLGYLNCLCLLYPKATDSKMSEFSKFCAKYDIDIWWYGMDAPEAPAPTYHIGDKNLLSARSVSWLQSKHDIKGNLYWDTAGYVIDDNEFTNVYEHPYRSSVYDWAAGDGILSYPGAAYGIYGPLPSMRLMSIRDGMEEYEILENVKAKVKIGFGTSNAVESAVSQFCDDVLCDDIIDMYLDGEHSLNFTSLRKQLIELACALDEGIGLVVGSTTSSGLLDATKTITYYAQEGATVTINGSTQNPISNCTYQYQYNSWFSSINDVRIIVNNTVGETATYSFQKTSSSSNASVTGNTSLEVIKNSAAGSSGTSGIPEVPDVSVGPKEELIFSFESYKDITGTALKVGNQIGETNINKDEQFVTQGSASWLVKPQGDYGKENAYPYFRMKCLDTTFLQSDFNDYDKVMMDIYNASDEAIQIEWNFAVINFVGTIEATEKMVCTLAPNAWTTCEYDLTGEEYGRNLLLNQMQYMTVTFLTKKDSKTDTVPALYLDNLRGHFADEERVITDIMLDFDKGITFEGEFEHYLFTSTASQNNNMELSRIAYEDSSIDVDSLVFDQYGLKGTVRNQLWPSFNINFGKTYPKGKILSFMVYVEANVSPDSEKTYRLGPSNGQNGTNHIVHTRLGMINRWVPVFIELTEDESSITFFVNLDDDYGNNILGDADVQIYFDNFYLWDTLEKADKANGAARIDGSYPGIYQYPILGKAGDVLSFDVTAPDGVPYSFWLLLDGTWGAGSEFQYFEQTKHVELVLSKDITFIQFQGAGSNIQLEFSNIKVTGDTIGIDGGYPGICRYPISGKAGQTLSFDVIEPTGVPYSFWLLLDGTWGAGSEFQYFEQTKHVELVLSKDITFIQLQGAGSNVQLEFSNIMVIGDTVGIDGDYPGICKYPIKGKAGQTLSFDVIEPTGVPYSFWLLLDGTWGAGSEFHYYEDKKHIELVLSRDITFIQLQGAGSGVQLEFENIKVQ